MKDTLKRFCTATASTLMIVATFVAASPVKTDAASTFKKLFKDYSDKKTVKTVAGHKVRNGNGNLDIMYSDETFWRPSSIKNYSPVFSDGNDIYYIDNKQLMKFSFELHKGEDVYDLSQLVSAEDTKTDDSYNIAAYKDNKFFINKTNYDRMNKIFSYDLETGETSESDGSIVDYKGNYLLTLEYKNDTEYSYYHSKFVDGGISKIKEVSKNSTSMMIFGGKNFYYLEFFPKKKKILLKTCKPDGSKKKTIKSFKYNGSSFQLSHKVNKTNTVFSINGRSYKLTFKNNKVTKTK